ncbi:hypothetical protein C8Q77DRAFT_496772 [Trametes polyzona]|nr:hypothetical protein C8Q77DRAFT_496772 [Trametes polyzona]
MAHPDGRELRRSRPRPPFRAIRRSALRAISREQGNQKAHGWPAAARCRLRTSGETPVCAKHASGANGWCAQHDERIPRVAARVSELRWYDGTACHEGATTRAVTASPSAVARIYLDEGRRRCITRPHSPLEWGATGMDVLYCTCIHHCQRSSLSGQYIDLSLIPYSLARLSPERMAVGHANTSRAKDSGPSTAARPRAGRAGRSMVETAPRCLVAHSARTRQNSRK